MKKVVVNGVEHEARPFGPDDLRPGAVVRHRAGRASYRLLCLDGDEAVLRNLRYPDKLTTWPASDLVRDFLLVM